MNRFGAIGCTIVFSGWFCFQAPAQAQPSGATGKALLVLADFDLAHEIVLHACEKAAPGQLPALQSAYAQWRERHRAAQLQVQERMIRELSTRRPGASDAASYESTLKAIQSRGAEILRKSLAARSVADLVAYCTDGYANGLASSEMDFSGRLESGSRGRQ